MTAFDHRFPPAGITPPMRRGNLYVVPPSRDEMAEHEAALLRGLRHALPLAAAFWLIVGALWLSWPRLAQIVQVMP